MHSASWRGRLPGYIAAFVAGTLFAWIAAPLWRMGVIAWNQEHYGLLVEQCDTAMREHFQAKQSVQQINDPQAQSLLDAAEIRRTNVSDRKRVIFNVAGRIAIFQLQSGSVINPFALPALSKFSCPKTF